MAFFGFGKKKKETPQTPAPAAPAAPAASADTAAQLVAKGHNWRASQNWSEAMECYKAAANMGDAEGLYWLGNCVLTGKGAVKNELLACQLYGLAAKQKHPQATDTLFRYLNAVLQEDKGNPAALAPYVKIGAEAGHLQCVCLYGYFLTIGGIGDIPQNKQEGYKWLKLAADNGLAMANDLLKEYF